ncbi:hypothetical protein M413DRAFT_279171 [Hebeloma cylindrosporum]|uniref:Uncharacterized protein n=1 Tax=Hebeloma cylindrosporum TaxID=76867 RepID=A0A0C3C0K2_HEBCY|nr:hypothetical protein M413DRAFT_279171 [Hebeloma cylindrosporum h7]
MNPIVSNCRFHRPFTYICKYFLVVLNAWLIPCTYVYNRLRRTPRGLLKHSEPSTSVPFHRARHLIHNFIVIFTERRWPTVYAQ